MGFCSFSACLLRLLLPALAIYARSVPVMAQEAHGIIIPRFIDPERRPERPETGRGLTIRFLTEEDYPPFHYIGPDGALTGFNIDMARMICAELAASCTIQVRRWDTLLSALETKAGDAVIASHKIDAELRRDYEASSILYRIPARFVGKRDTSVKSVEAPDLAGKTVAVVAGSAHEAYLNAFFPALALKRFSRLDIALEVMRRGEADLAFGDGVAMGFWLNGSESLGCCGFVGGAFTESRYFGEGTGILMRKGDATLRNAIDYALWRISREGGFKRAYLKHFPVPFY